MTNSARLEREQDPDDPTYSCGTQPDRGSVDGFSNSLPPTSSTYAFLAAAAALIKTVPAGPTPATAALPDQPAGSDILPDACTHVDADRTPATSKSTKARKHIVGLVLAAVAAVSIGFYGVPAFRLLRYDINQNTLISRYHQAYTECLAAAGNVKRCPPLIYYRCTEDPFWKTSPSVPWPLKPNLTSSAVRCLIS